MGAIGKFMLRKIIYVAAGTATGALSAYLTGHPDIAAWTFHGAVISVGTAVWGAVLSNVLGGSLGTKAS